MKEELFFFWSEHHRTGVWISLCGFCLLMEIFSVSLRAPFVMSFTEHWLCSKKEKKNCTINVKPPVVMVTVWPTSLCRRCFCACSWQRALLYSSSWLCSAGTFLWASSFSCSCTQWQQAEIYLSRTTGRADGNPNKQTLRVQQHVLATWRYVTSSQPAFQPVLSLPVLKGSIVVVFLI